MAEEGKSSKGHKGLSVGLIGLLKKNKKEKVEQKAPVGILSPTPKPKLPEVNKKETFDLKGLREALDLTQAENRFRIWTVKTTALREFARVNNIRAYQGSNGYRICRAYGDEILETVGNVYMCTLVSFINEYLVLLIATCTEESVGKILKGKTKENFLDMAKHENVEVWGIEMEGEGIDGFEEVVYTPDECITFLIPQGTQDVEAFTEELFGTTDTEKVKHMVDRNNNRRNR